MEVVKLKFNGEYRNFAHWFIGLSKLQDALLVLGGSGGGGGNGTSQKAEVEKFKRVKKKCIVLGLAASKPPPLRLWRR